MPTTRRSLILAVAAAAIAGPAAAQAGLTAADQALVQRATAYLEGLTQAKARFIQTDPRGQVSRGTLWLKRPGKARFAYDPPSGLFGGHGGHPLRLYKIDPDGTEVPLDSKQTNHAMAPGSVLVWEQACGGGYGDPLERDPEAVLRDVREELVSLEDAREHYGVVIDPAGESIDRARTEELRAQRGGTR